MKKMFKRATATTVLSVSILTSATMITANAATITYTVKSGDTLSAIAKKYNVSLASLESANKITNPSIIKTGRVLTIPSTTTKTPTAVINTKNNSIVTYAVYTGTATIKTATSLYSSPSTSSKMIKSLPKGSKWKLYGYRSDGWYNLGPGWIKASCASTSISTKGIATTISGGTISASTTSAKPVNTKLIPSTATTSATLNYTIKSGDTLSAIAKKYHVSLPSLESANKITNPSIIKVGQVLIIPSASTKTPTVSTNTKNNSTVTYTVYTGTSTIKTATSLYSSPSTSSKIVKALPKGSKWKLYGYRSDGWYNLGPGWVKASCASISISTKGATTSAVPIPPAPAPGQMMYKVLSGDNATSIAIKYNMTLAKLKQINPQVTDWNTLVAMQQILVSTPSAALSDVIVTTKVTSDMKSAFIAQVAPAAIQAWQTNKILPSLTIAQAILESYWGGSYLSVNAQNYFGIKASIGWKGSTITLQTKEYDKNGNLYVENVAFRAYDSISDSIADHTQFLMAIRYSNIIGLTDYKTVTTLIQKDGYATDPNYPNLLQSVITSYNLTQYDVQAGAIVSSN